jgi:hypothetical protein
MGKFTKYSTAVTPKERPWKVHPLWQGIGCVMVVLIPLISYAGGVLLVDATIENGWFQIPREFYGPPGNPLLYSYLGVAVLFSVFGYLLFVIIYLIFYRFMGPPLLGPTDAPPPKRTKGPRKYSR